MSHLPKLDTPKGVIAFFNKTKMKRSNTEQVWEEIAEHGLGSREFITKRQTGVNRFRRIYDTTFRQSAQLLAGALHGMLVTPNAPWFFLRAENPQDNQDFEAKIWLEQAAAIMYENFTRADSAWTQTIAESLLDIAAFGNCAYWIEDAGGNRGARFISRALSEVYIVTNDSGNMIAFFRKYDMPAYEVVKRWKDVGPEITRIAEKNPMEDICLIEVVYRTDEGISGPFNRPWKRAIVTERFEKFINGSEQGFFENPMIYGRWFKEVYEDYGRGAGWVGISTARMLNEMQKTFLKAAQKAADPPLIVFDDGQLLQVRTGPGGLNVFQGLPGDGAPLQPLPTGADHRITAEVIRQHQKMVEQAFHAQMLQLFEDPNMTATQVIELANQTQRLMAPMIGRMEVEMLEPTLERVFNINLRQGNFPDAPSALRGRRLKIDYVSPIAKAQKVQHARGILEVWQAAAILEQSGGVGVTSMLDADESLRLLADASGVPVSILRSQEEVEQIRLAEQQVAEQQAAMEQLQQVAGMAKDTGVQLGGPEAGAPPGAPPIQ